MKKWKVCMAFEKKIIKRAQENWNYCFYNSSCKTLSTNLWCQPLSEIDQLRTSLSLLVNEKGDSCQEGSTDQLGGKFANCSVPVISVPASAALGGVIGYENFTVGISCICNQYHSSRGHNITARRIMTCGCSIPIWVITVGLGIATGGSTGCSDPLIAEFACTGISGGVWGSSI
jgi:hypothetical protein